MCIRRRNVKAFRRLFFGAACSPPPPRFLFALPVAFEANGHWNCLLFEACLLPYVAGGAFYMVYLRRPAFWRPVSPLSAREGEPICRYLLQLIFASLRFQISLSCQYFSIIPHPLKISLGDSKNCLLRQFLLS